LKEKILNSSETKHILENSRLKFNDSILEDNRLLSSYGIKNNSIISVEKYYDPALKFGLKFVIAQDSITGENNGLLKAALSCGHAADPNTLTAWCRSLIDDGKLEFFCPAIIKVGTHEKCDKKWGYDEIKKIALLNQIETEYFEKKLSENAANTYMDYKECPKCRSFIIRQDLTNLRVYCTLCPVFSDKSFEFCWQCEKEWTVSLNRSSESCGRENCVNPLLEILQNCIFNKKNPLVFGVEVVKGNLHIGTHLSDPSTNTYIGKVVSIQNNHKDVEIGKKTSSVCIKVDNQENPNIAYGRQFDYTNTLYSRISRESLDILKEYYKEECTRDDLMLIMELKKLFNIK
jgi:hypothetical protein